MKAKTVLLFFLFQFIYTKNYFSQILVIDTITKGYYLKYQIDPESKQKTGTYEMIYKDKIITKGNYKNNNRSGFWEFIGMNDTLQQKGSYDNGSKEGVWESYYSDGKISCLMPYKNGRKNGIFKGFYKNGNPSFETNFVNDSVQGISTNYYVNGKISEMETYVDDTLNGISKRYYENGTLKETKFKKGSKRDSVYLFYYEDGSLWEHLIYKNGSPYNVIASNTANGEPIDCCTLKNGTGIMRFYDKEGRITDEDSYKNSVKDGYSKQFEKGILLEEGNYKEGKWDGLWIKNYPTGELLSKINCVDGNKQGESNYYYKKGTVSQKGNYENNKKSGIWISYDEKGKVTSELNYKEGLLDDDGKYYSDGKLVCSGKHNKGVRVFVWSFYDTKGNVKSSYDYGYTFVSKDDKKEIINDPPQINEEPSLNIVEQMPSFPGGERMMMEFIQKNIVYPEVSKEAGISGTVYITFVVENTGEINEVKVLRGVSGGPDCDKEALRIITIMPRWNPGLQNGRPVRVSFNLPIKYTLK